MRHQTRKYPIRSAESKQNSESSTSQDNSKIMANTYNKHVILSTFQQSKKYLPNSPLTLKILQEYWFFWFSDKSDKYCIKTFGLDACLIMYWNFNKILCFTCSALDKIFGFRILFSVFFMPFGRNRKTKFPLGIPLGNRIERN